MSNIPPVDGYANYPRVDPGAVTKLQTLVDGYFGLNKPFLVNFILVMLGNIATRMMNPSESGGVLIGFLVIVPVILFVLAKPQVAKVGAGLGWSSGTVIGYTILIAILFWFCFGAIGFIVVQGKAMKEIKAMGFQGGGMFVSKKSILAFVEEFKARAGNSGTMPPMSV